MKKIVVAIMLHSLMSVALIKAEISASQLQEISTTGDAISAQYEKITKLITSLTVGLGKTISVVEDSATNYGDKFVQIAAFLNQLNPVLEILVGTSTQDIIKEHKELGILRETNKLLQLLEKKQLSDLAVTQLQDAVAKLESLSRFLVNSAPAVKGLKP